MVASGSVNQAAMISRFAVHCRDRIHNPQQNRRAVVAVTLDRSCASEGNCHETFSIPIAQANGNAPSSPPTMPKKTTRCGATRGLRPAVQCKPATTKPKHTSSISPIKPASLGTETDIEDDHRGRGEQVGNPSGEKRWTNVGTRDRWHPSPTRDPMPIPTTTPSSQNTLTF